MGAVANGFKFNELYLEHYDTSVSVGMMTLADMVHHDFGVEVGTVVRTTDKNDRRVLILVGASSNTIIADDRGGLPGSLFKLISKWPRLGHLPRLITDIHVPYIYDIFVADKQPV